MATVNRTSLRDALEELKARSAALHEAPEPELAEYRALVADQNALLELIATVLLEKLTPKSSRNSSIPPSQTDGDGDPTSRSRNRKKREEVPESPASTRTREEHHVHEAHACKHCGEKLTGTEATDHERRTRIDVVFEKVVEHHDAEIRHCPHCHGETRAAFPDDLHGPRQYGVGIRVFAVHQLMQMVPLRRTVQSLSAMIGEKLSEATLLGFLTRVHKALAGWEARARQYLLAMPAMHVDETSLRVEKKKPWIHVYSAGEITLKFLHGKRGREAIDDIGLIPKYRNVIIHDCHAPYLSYDHCSHGLCGAHLLRDITFIIDAVNPRWARRMKKLLRDYARRVAKSDECILTDREFRVLRQQYRTILTQARTQHELPPVPPRTKGQRGPVAKPASVTLWQRLKTREADILRFAHDPAVAFTNNRAERDLRMAKVKQKVSGCFRNAAFAKVYCRVSSYLQSMAYSGYSPFQAIHIALAGHAADYVPAAGGGVSSYVQRGVRVTSLKINGAVRFVVSGGTEGNVHLRTALFRVATDDTRSLRLSKAIVSAKLQNSRMVVDRWSRDERNSGERAWLATRGSQIWDRISRVGKAQTSDQIRGIEGDGARIYFRAMGRVLATSNLGFSTRSRRPPRDPVNAMLGFCYGLMVTEYIGAVESVGLDYQMGFFHRPRSGRPSLALDLAEELRALTDRFVVSIVRRRQIAADSFVRMPGGGVYLSDDGRTRLIKAWEAHRDSTVPHRLLGRPVGRWALPSIQATLLARHLRGDLPAYPPFVLS